MTEQAATQAEHLRRLPMHSLALVILTCLAVAPAFASKPDSVPDWVRTAAQQKLPEYSAETNAVVLLEDTVYTVAPNGTAIEHHRHVIKILRPQGRREGIVGVSFDKDTKILSMHVWSIGPDGHEYEVKDKEMTEHGYGEGNLFEDDKVRIAPLQAAIPAVSSLTSTSSVATPTSPRRHGSSRAISLTSTRASRSSFHQTSPTAPS